MESNQKYTNLSSLQLCKGPQVILITSAQIKAAIILLIQVKSITLQCDLEKEVYR